MPEEELLLNKLSQLTDRIYSWDQARQKLYQQDREVTQHLLLSDPLRLQRLLQTLRNQNQPVALTSGRSVGGICTASGRCILVGPLDEKGMEDAAVLRERIRGINTLLELYASFELRTAERNQPFNLEKFKDFLQQLKADSKIPLPDLSDVISAETPHNSYAYELGHLEGITQGNPEKALRALLSPMHGQEGRMGFTDLRHHKNSAIINAVLAARAAIRGGLPVETAYTTADFFILAAEMCRSCDEAVLLRQTITYRFAALVQDIRDRQNQDLRPQVRQMVQELERRVFQKCDRSEVAAAAGCNPDYADRIFKEDLNMSIMDYLRELRIRTAQDLLAGSRLKIGEISALLQFSSTSHFARVFKKLTGTTPLDFRAQS